MRSDDLQAVFDTIESRSGVGAALVAASREAIMREIDMASVDESRALAVRHSALVDRTICRSWPALSRCYYKGMPSTSKDDEPCELLGMLSDTQRITLQR